MKISTKLFLAFFGLTALVLVTTLSLARWSFEQGFMDFISGLERQRLTSTAVTLAQEYADSGNSWAGVKRLGLDYYVDQRRGPPRQIDHRRGPPPPPPRSPKPNDAPPTALYNAQGEWIAGLNVEDTRGAPFVMPIEANGNTIGELRSFPATALNSGIASQFLHQQQVASIIIGLVCLFASILISWLLSRKILTPIESVITGVAQLAEGNFKVKFKQQRSDELGQLMHNVEYLSTTLEKTRTAKNRMFADISHELRTPLTILSGEIEVLKAGIRPFDMQQLASLEQETDLLKHLVDDLYQLSMSDVGALKYHFEITDLGNCITRTLNGMQLAAHIKGLQLDVSVVDNVTLKLDQKRIEQLFLNLCSNAIAYTDEPGTIKVVMHKLEGAIRVSFDDTKPTVSSRDCENLFEPLFRLDESRTRKQSGAGLGLAISKNIVEAHEGRIWAQPSADGGLQVNVEFPYLG